MSRRGVRYHGVWMTDADVTNSMFTAAFGKENRGGRASDGIPDTPLQTPARGGVLCGGEWSADKTVLGDAVPMQPLRAEATPAHPPSRACKR